MKVEAKFLIASSSLITGTRWRRAGVVVQGEMVEIFEGGRNVLNLDVKLLPGDYLVSTDRKSKAVLQEDGNFVVRH